MGLIDLALLGLTGTAVLFSIIELGLSARLVDAYNFRFYLSDVNARASFLVFNSVWTIVIAGLLLVFGFMFRSRGETTKSRGWLAPVTLALNSITMIFWLAGFAAWAAIPRWGYGELDAAILAFAVLLWLIFLAILAINISTTIGFLRSDRPGYNSQTRQRTLP